MEGNKRREKILEMLEEEETPLSGVKLATLFDVSRQVIVQDVALLRAKGYDILATARGYILNKEASSMYSRVIMVRHTQDELEDELNTIVDNGGRVKNAIINHPVYGELIGGLMLKNRRDVQIFMNKVAEENAYPLLRLTQGVHMHTIESLCEEELDVIEKELERKGYLYKQ
ncbi:MAG: transcription repressor NadR [Cellulosilyticaceae bacterium]